MANELKVIVYMTAILGTGYGLMKYTVPDEETMRKVRSQNITPTNQELKK